MIRDIARLLWERAMCEAEPEKDPIVGPLAIHVVNLYGRPVHATTPVEWEEALLDAIAQRITEKWDRYGAPSAARDPQGEGYIASFEGPGDPVTVKAETKRKAYQEARKLWIKRLLDEL
jgi:hypothetical protein